MNRRVSYIHQDLWCLKKASDGPYPAEQRWALVMEMVCTCKFFFCTITSLWSWFNSVRRGREGTTRRVSPLFLHWTLAVSLSSSKCSMEEDGAHWCVGQDCQYWALSFLTKSFTQKCIWAALQHDVHHQHLMSAFKCYSASALECLLILMHINLKNKFCVWVS